MREILEAAVELQRFCDEQGWRSCLIGGLAVIRWGEARATRDVDITLLTGFGDEDEFITTLLGRFAPRAADAREFALVARVLLLESPSGVGLDVGLAGFPVEESCVVRSTEFDYEEGFRLRTATAEDLVVMKSLANRDIDWQDVEGILVKQFDVFDWDYTLHQVRSLAEVFPESEAAEKLLSFRDLIRTKRRCHR